MALNYIWIGFFIIAFITGIVKLMFNGDAEVFTLMVNSTFDMAETSVKISIYLIGVITLWMGIMKVGEKGGAVNVLSRIAGPFFNKLFPEVPKDHPANGSMVMNFCANMLGLDNAATPLGLKAMHELQELNTDKETASNSQIMFLVLNTSGLTIVPVSIMAIRAAEGAASPAEVFIPILLATYCSTLAGLLAVSVMQKINLLNKTVISYIGSVTLLIIGIIWYFSTLPQEKISVVSTVSANVLLFSIIISFVVLAVVKKVNVYEGFVEGAKEGFGVAVKIIPYLVAMLVAIGVFRASGAMDMIIEGIGYIFRLVLPDTDFVEGLPTAFMKPLSGSGARAMMIETIHKHGVDSFAGKLSATLQGSTETTFYTLAVYFGAVNIRKTRNAVTCGLIADFAGITAAIFIAYLFFH